MALHEIIEHIKEAQRLGRDLGVKNILQPGIVKEMILADRLGHEVIPDKDKADARDSAGSLYEYLCSLTTSNNFQIDRVTEDNLHRITRNKAFYFAFFSDPVTIQVIYEISTDTVLEEAERQLAKSKNSISHMNLPGAWVKRNGRVVG